jgi:hypothetical protein
MEYIFLVNFLHPKNLYHLYFILAAKQARPVPVDVPVCVIDILFFFCLL